VRASSVLSAKGDEFVPPSSVDFVLPPIFENISFITKPILLVIFSALVIGLIFSISARKAAVVPSKAQFAGELIYGFVRKDLGQEIIGHEFKRFMPYLFSLFTFILLNNFFILDFYCSYDFFISYDFHYLLL
jgi:F-type H+-transporting ATPase subunit a